MSKKKEQEQWKDAEGIPEEENANKQEQQQPQQKPIQPTDMLDMDALVFEIGAQHVNIMGYGKMVDKQRELFQKEFQKLKNEKSEIRKKVEEELTLSDDKKTEKINDFSQSITELRNELAKEKEQKKSLESEKQSLEHNQKEVTALNDKINQLSKTIERLKSENKSLQDTNRDLYIEVKKYEEEKSQHIRHDQEEKPQKKSNFNFNKRR